MPHVVIEDVGCRGCSQCVDVCPVDVFAPEILPEQNHQIARVKRSYDCVGCLSCYYRCPSQCVQVTDVELQSPFYRIEENVAFLERFLKTDTATKNLTEADWREAYGDVAMTLVALSNAIPTILGRGLTAVGRRSGILAASHLPEAYEEKTLTGILERLQERFQNSFDFDFNLTGSDVDFTFKPCSLYRIVEDSGEKAGEAVLCRLFHEYMAGLISSFDGNRYRPKFVSAGTTCSVRLLAQ